ncbi:DUF190 domain-containing protein [Blastococcus deserti]|uniref:Fluoride-specific ion channel FluC n=1 Tax=Blastococcus deserti TaxID=2259033 RepID=A0ABW4XGR5_9ACTN
MHSTRILSLAEDLPISVVIVDTAERIEALLPDLKDRRRRAGARGGRPRRAPRRTGDGMTVPWVALGAAIGAPARYLTDRAVQGRHERVLPWGTPTGDMIGSFLLGRLTAMSTHLPPAVGAAIGVGFCGALTTYSTHHLQHVRYEILRLLEDRARFYAAANVVDVRLLGGFGAVGLGWTLGTWSPDRCA